jgi:hypothetical protein
MACQHPPPVHLFIIIIIVIIIVITIKILVIIIIIVYNPVSANLRRQTVRTDIVPQRENSIFFRLLEVKLPGHNKAPSFGPEKMKYGVVQGRFSLILSTSPHNDETFFFCEFCHCFRDGICTLSPPHATPTMRFAERFVQGAAPGKQNGFIFLKSTRRYCASYIKQLSIVISVAVLPWSPFLTMRTNSWSWFQSSLAHG